MNEKMGRSRAYGPVLSRIRRLIMVVLIILAIILCVFLYRISKRMEMENIKLSQDIENLHSGIQNEDDKKEELSKAKNRSVSDEEYESLAREELGLIKKDEIVIKPR